MITVYTHIVWDFDGTLFDTYPVMADVFRQLLLQRGFAEDGGAILGAMKVSMSAAYEIYREKYGIDEAFMAEYRALKRGEELARCKPFPGAAALCRDIHAAGRFNYLCTHRSNTALAMLQKAGLYDCFRDFTTSEHNFARKPSPQAVCHLIDTYGINPEEMLMVGDRDLDILAGKSAGADACFFAGQGGACAEADYTVTSFSELYGLIGIAPSV